MRTPSPRLRTRVLLLVGGLMLATGGCGDEGLLDGLGERGHEYVEGSTTFAPIETTVTSEAPVGAAPIEGMRWYNEEISGETIGDPSFVIGSVWGRGDGITRFIQASPAEIASALPGIQFPTLVPNETLSITSQLVYDVASGRLDPGLSAAFGFWTATPYQGDNRSVAVLRVAQGASSSQPAGVTVVPAEGGRNLRWIDGVYSYELFCRNELPEQVCEQMAGSRVALELIAPSAPATG